MYIGLAQEKGRLCFLILTLFLLLAYFYGLHRMHYVATSCTHFILVHIALLAYQEKGGRKTCIKAESILTRGQHGQEYIFHSTYPPCQKNKCYEKPPTMTGHQYQQLKHPMRSLSSAIVLRSLEPQYVGTMKIGHAA